MEISKQPGGVERISRAYVLQGAANVLRERSVEMAEMQRRVIHLLTQLMKKGIVVSCVSEVVGVVEERQKREEEEEERGEKREIGREWKESVDALNDEMDVFLNNAKRMQIRGEKREEDGEKKEMAEELVRLMREIEEVKRENEQMKKRESEETKRMKGEIDKLKNENSGYMNLINTLQTSQSSLNNHAQQKEAPPPVPPPPTPQIGTSITNVSETVVKIPNREITIQERNRFHNKSDKLETIIIGNKMSRV